MSGYLLGVRVVLEGASPECVSHGSGSRVNNLTMPSGRCPLLTRMCESIPHSTRSRGPRFNHHRFLQTCSARAAPARPAPRPQEGCAGTHTEIVLCGAVQVGSWSERHFCLTRP